MDKYLNSPEVSERTMREMMRGAQVQEQKAKFGADATVGKTAVYNDPVMRERVEQELLRRDRATTLYRWQDERRLTIAGIGNIGSRMRVTITRPGPNRGGDDVVFFEEDDAVFPSVKLMADVALAMVGMGV